MRIVSVIAQGVDGVAAVGGRRFGLYQLAHNNCADAGAKQLGEKLADVSCGDEAEDAHSEGESAIVKALGSVSRQ